MSPLRSLPHDPDFRRGVRDMLAFGPGIAAWGLVTGVAMVKSGLSLPLAIFMSLLMWGVVYQGYNAVFPSFYPEMFPTRTRVSGMAISQNLGTAVTALLPALFVTVAPPGAANIPLTIGAITFAITVIAAISAWTARETYRVHLNDLGDPNAVPVPKPDYDQIREQAMVHGQLAKA